MVASRASLTCPQEVPEFDTSLPLSQWDGGPDISDFCTPVDEITATYEDVVTVNVDQRLHHGAHVDVCGPVWQQDLL